MFKYGCPFCGEIAGLKETSIHVQCRRCGAVGPYLAFGTATPTEAADPTELWNIRKALADIEVRISREELLAAQRIYRRVDGFVEGAKRTQFCVIVPCTSQKTELPNLEVTLASMRPAIQDELQKQWLERISKETPKVTARNMYAGRSVRILAPLAMANEADMYIVSTGVGLTAADQNIPAYDLTLHRDSDSSLYRKVLGPFNPRGWWKGMQESPYNTPLKTIVQENQNAVIILALSDDFMDMMYDDLEEVSKLDPSVTDRIRIIGIGAVPPTLQKCVLPYSEVSTRGTLRPGSRLDFSYRAAHHYISEWLLTDERNPADHTSCVSWVKGVSPAQIQTFTALGETNGFVRASATYTVGSYDSERGGGLGVGRPQIHGDQMIMDLIRERGLARLAITTGLASLRAQGISCSNARYTRLLDIARRETVMEGVPT